MKNLKQFCVYPLIALCLFSCCKDTDDCNKVVDPDCDGKLYNYWSRYNPDFGPYLFKVGSWWDYKNTTTGDVKRISITQSYVQNDTMNAWDVLGAQLIRERYFIWGNDEVVNKIFIDEFDFTNVSRKDSATGSIGLFLYLKSTGIVVDSVGTLNTLSVQSSIYNNINYCRLPKSSYTYPYYESDVFIYWVPFTGFIKIEKVDSLNNLIETWELVNKNIVL